MKKLVLVISAIVVLLAFAVPVFAVDMYAPEQRNAKLAEVKASPLKVGGEFTFGMLTPFDSDYAAIGFANAYVDFTWYPDEYNSLLLEMAFTKEYSGSAIILGSPGVSFPYFELTSDVGKALDLPIGLTNTIGLSSLYTNKFEVSGHAWERTKIRSWIDPLAWKPKVDAGMVQVTAGIGFGERTNDPTVPWNTGAAEEKGQFNDFGIYAFIPELGPTEVELWYLSQNNPDFKGNLGFSVKTIPLMNDMLSFAGGFVFNLVDGSALGGPQDGGWAAYKDLSGLAIDDKFWGWGVGAKANVVGAGIGLSMNGDVNDAFDQLAVDVDYAIGGGPFGINAAGGFTFAENAPSNFLGAEFSAYVKIGGAKWNIGYLLDGDENDGYGYAYTVAKVFGGSKGGLFVVGDINF